MKEVIVYTDGACRGNPGPGGWAAILRYGSHTRELSGGEALTTNNRMELTAAIRGLEALKEPCIVQLHSDSKYLVDAMEKGWALSWQRKGWMRGKNEPAKNPELWERLLALTATHRVTFCWVKGHNGHEWNERCDQLATAAADSYRIGEQK